VIAPTLRWPGFTATSSGRQVHPDAK